MSENNIFNSEMQKILEMSNMPKSFIQDFRNIKTDSLISKIKEIMHGFAKWDELNFIVYSWSLGRNSLIGRASPLDSKSASLDNAIYLLDDKYPELGINSRLQEDIPIKRFYKTYDKIFEDLVGEIMKDKKQPLIILSRYDEIESCRIVRYC